MFGIKTMVGTSFYTIEKKCVVGTKSTVCHKLFREGPEESKSDSDAVIVLEPPKKKHPKHSTS